MTSCLFLPLFKTLLANIIDFISEEEFYLDIDENDIRLKEFFEIVKLNLSDHQFIFNTLQEIENEKTQDELYDMFLNG